VSDLIRRLLASPIDTELSSRELAELVAYLAQRISLSQIQYERATAGRSPTLEKRAHLVAILRFNREVARAMAGGVEEANDQYLVTLAQAAAIVSRSKRTLERWVKDDPHFPLPDCEGGGGRPSEWEWRRLRDYLEKKTRRQLPERFPTDPFRPDFGALES